MGGGHGWGPSRDGRPWRGDAFQPLRLPPAPRSPKVLECDELAAWVEDRERAASDLHDPDLSSERLLATSFEPKDADPRSGKRVSILHAWSCASAPEGLDGTAASYDRWVALQDMKRVPYRFERASKHDARDGSLTTVPRVPTL